MKFSNTILKTFISIITKLASKKEVKFPGYKLIANSYCQNLKKMNMIECHIKEHGDFQIVVYL